MVYNVNEMVYNNCKGGDGDARYGSDANTD